MLNTPAHVFVKLAVLVGNEQVFMSLGNSLSGCVTQRKATSVAKGLERTAELLLEPSSAGTEPVEATLKRQVDMI